MALTEQGLTPRHRALLSGSQLSRTIGTASAQLKSLFIELGEEFRMLSINADLHVDLVHTP